MALCYLPVSNGQESRRSGNVRCHERLPWIPALWLAVSSEVPKADEQVGSSSGDAGVHFSAWMTEAYSPDLYPPAVLCVTPSQPATRAGKKVTL